MSHRAKAIPIGAGHTWCIEVDGQRYGPEMPSGPSARAVAHWLNTGGLQGVEGHRDRPPSLTVAPYQRPQRQPDPVGASRALEIVEALSGKTKETG